MMALTPVAVMVALGLCFGVSMLLQLDVSKKQGVAILGLVLVIALTNLLVQAFATKSVRLISLGVVAAGVVCVGYFGAFLLIDRIFTASVSYQVVAPSHLDFPVFCLVAAGFLGVFVMQLLAVSKGSQPWFRAFYVHAMHGFYLDIPARRLTAFFWGRTIPAP